MAEARPAAKKKKPEQVEVRPTPILKQVRRTRVSDDVLLQLADKIVKSEYAVGEKLPSERDLAVAFDVTRASLREALRQLENMGLISVRQGDGVYVEDFRTNASMDFVKFMFSTGVGIDVDFLVSVEEMRRMLALRMLELAAERADEESLARLQAIADNFPTQVTPELLAGDWDFNFFHELALATHNQFFVYLLNTIKDVFRQIRLLYSEVEGSPASSTTKEIYQQLVEVLKMHDREKAREAGEARMDRYATMLRGFLKTMENKEQ